MSVIVAAIGGVLLSMAIYAVVVTRGGILNAISYLELAKRIAVSIFAVLLMSFYGGIAGGAIMLLAAFVRKGRESNNDSVSD